MALFQHLEKDGFVSLEQFCAALSIVLKGERVQKFEFMWQLWDRDHDRALATGEFRSFIESVCVCFYQQTSRRGVTFGVARAKLDSFSGGLVGRDRDGASITYDDAFGECITNGRLDQYFGGAEALDATRSDVN